MHKGEDGRHHNRRPHLEPVQGRQKVTGNPGIHTRGETRVAWSALQMAHRTKKQGKPAESASASRAMHPVLQDSQWMDSIREAS